VKTKETGLDDNLTESDSTFSSSTNDLPDPKTGVVHFNVEALVTVPFIDFFPPNRQLNFWRTPKPSPRTVNVLPPSSLPTLGTKEDITTPEVYWK
jgi:hypothetical protein